MRTGGLPLVSQVGKQLRYLSYNLLPPCGMLNWNQSWFWDSNPDTDMGCRNNSSGILLLFQSLLDYEEVKCKSVPVLSCYCDTVSWFSYTNSLWLDVNFYRSCMKTVSGICPQVLTSSIIFSFSDILCNLVLKVSMYLPAAVESSTATFACCSWMPLLHKWFCIKAS